MQKIAWNDLQTYLIDPTDLANSFNWVQADQGQNALAFFGQGVQTTGTYPNPFPITLSQSAMTGQVGPGIAFDANGQLCRIDPTTQVSTTFTLSPADPMYTRYDLLVIEYVQAGSVPIPQPSNPNNTINFLLSDSFQLKVIAGSPASTPYYPAKGPLDVVLAGIQVPANVTQASYCLVDLGARDNGGGAQVPPTFVQALLSGVVDGQNATFTLPATPLRPESVIVKLDEISLAPSEYTLSGQTITLTSAPALGQSVSAFFVKTGSSNLAGFYDTNLTGTIDGNNTLFNLGGQPTNQSTLFIFVNGRFVEPTDYALIQNIGQSQIQFLNDAQPTLGQDLFAWYLVNSATIGVAGTTNSSSGGGGASRTIYPPFYAALNDGNINTGSVSLPWNPPNPSYVTVDIVNGVPCQYGVDYTVQGNLLSWSNLGLASVATNSTVLRVLYFG